MVEILTPTAGVQARKAGQVSNAPAQALQRASGAMQQAANTFTQFYEKEAAIQNDLLLATTQSDWTKRYEQEKGNASAGFADRMVGEYDQYVSQVLETAPKRGRDQLELALQKYRINLETKAIQREAAARAAAKAAAVAEANRLKANALLSDPSLLPDYLEGASSQQRSVFIKAALSGQLMTDPASVNEAVTGGQWDADLSPSEKLSFMKSSARGVEEIQRENEAIARAQQRSLQEDLANELAYAQVTGGELPADTQLTDENIELLSNGDSEWATEFKRVRDQGVMDARNLNAVATATPEEIATMAGNYQSDILDDPARTEEDLRRAASFQNAVNARNTAIADDAAGYVTQYNPVLQDAWSVYSSADPETKADAAGQYAALVTDEMIRIGVPPQFRNILPKSVAKDIVSNLNQAGADVAPQMLADISSQWRGNAQQIIAELERAGLAKEYVEAMREADNPALSSKIANLVGQSEADLKANLVIKPNDVVMEVNAALQDYYEAYTQGDETGQANRIFNNRLEITRKLIFKDIGAGADMNTAIKTYLGQMFPETVLQGRNINLVLPENVQADAFEQALENYMKPETLALRGVVPLDDPRLPELADKALLYESLKSNGVWLNDSTGTGATLALKVNGSYLPMMLEDGSYYTIPFDMGFAGGDKFDFGLLVPRVQ